MVRVNDTQTQRGNKMTTIRNTNEKYGDGIEFSGYTLVDAVEAMQIAVRECGPEFACVEVTDVDYVIVED